MERFCLGVLLGAIGALWFPTLPSTAWLLFAIFVSLMLRSLCCVGAVMFLVSLSWHYQQHLNQAQKLLAQHNTVWTGTVVSIPKEYDDSTSFLWQLDDQGQQSAHGLAGTLLQISWQQPPVTIQQGQRWSLPLRLKAIRGLANPGSGQRDTNALVQGVIAQGTVRAGQDSSIRYLGGHAVWRQQVYDAMVRTLAELPTRPLLIALTVGERPFDDEMWLGLQATGLGHLISISGMHVALLFGWVLLLQPLWQRMIPGAMSGKLVAFAVALSAAWAYSALSGFAIPTVRAMVALMLAVLLKLCLHRYSGRQFCLLLAAMLLLWQPLWLLSLSFWLTVCAVGLVFFLQWRYPAPVVATHWTWLQLRRQLWHFLRYQWLFCLIMLPFGLLLFQGIAPLALLSNLIFVPWCSLIGIPLLLIVFVMEQLTLQPLDRLWWALDKIFYPLDSWLQFAATDGWWWSIPQQNAHAAILSLVGVLCWFLPIKRLRWGLLLVFSLPLLVLQIAPTWPKLHLIDVGQGTSVLLQQGTSGVLYDLGPRYGSFSVTRSQVLPYVRYVGIRQLDFVILSHDDSDHSGDPSVMRRAFPSMQLVSDSARFQPDLSCRELPRHWHGFELWLLWPRVDSSSHSSTHSSTHSTNDSSCVLFLQQGLFSMLLPGDIGRSIEQQLLRVYPSMQVDVLLLGHHGSHGSNSLPWLHQLTPQLVLNSSGFGNPYRHPAQKVVSRLDLLQLPLYDTAQLGAIQLIFQPERILLDSYRLRRQVKWVENMPLHAETAPTTR